MEQDGLGTLVSAYQYLSPRCCANAEEIEILRHRIIDFGVAMQQLG
jgi:hypothetical protein